jgi:hypothetical protein
MMIINQWQTIRVPQHNQLCSGQTVMEFVFHGISRGINENFRSVRVCVVHIVYILIYTRMYDHMMYL